MLGKLRCMLDNQKGFTLIELMTVLIILGVILGIGVPKYLKIQAKAEWDADYKTIQNIAKAAEVYAAQKNLYGSPVGIKAVLINKNIIEGNLVLNRIKSGSTSAKNEGNTKLLEMLSTDKSFSFDGTSGRVTQATFDAVVDALIGPTPY